MRRAARVRCGARLVPVRAAALALVAACTAGEGESPTWGLAREQPRADPWEASKVLPGGMVMQRPPPGTVPWTPSTGDARPDVRVDPRDTIAARAVGTIPLSATPELLALGRSRFEIFCAACHGAGGYGGSVVAMNMVRDPPPSLRTPHMLAHGPGHVYAVIRNGKGRMPSYAAQLSVTERWAVVAYLQELQRRPAATAAERTDSVRAEMMRRRRAP